MNINFYSVLILLFCLFVLICPLFFVCIIDTPDSSMSDELLPNSDKCLVKCRPIRATPIKISLDHQKPLVKDGKCYLIVKTPT